MWHSNADISGAGEDERSGKAVSGNQLLALPYLVQYIYNMLRCITSYLRKSQKQNGYWSWAPLIRVAILVSSGREGSSRWITLSTYFTYLIHLSVYCMYMTAIIFADLYLAPYVCFQTCCTQAFFCILFWFYIMHLWFYHFYFFILIFILAIQFFNLKWIALSKGVFALSQHHITIIKLYSNGNNIVYCNRFMTCRLIINSSKILFFQMNCPFSCCTSDTGILKSTEQDAILNNNKQP